MAAAIRIAIHSRLAAIAPEFCDQVIGGVRSRLAGFSLAVAQAPDSPGALSLLIDPPVLPICIDRNEVLFGPLWVPERSVCPACLDHWLDMNLMHREEPNVALGPALAERFTHAVQRWSDQFRKTGIVEDFRADALSISMVDDRISHHPVFPRRDCPRCSLIPRAEMPSLRVHCSSWTGIVAGMELTSHPSAGAYRATATWTPPRPVPGARPCLRRRQSYGRGATQRIAETGCVGEALERYSLVYRGDENLIRATYSAADAIHPDRIQLFSVSQYRGRSEWNETADELFWVPEPFVPDVSVDWLEANRLGGAGEAVLVPAACCLMWYEFRAGEPEFARADTIGCAAGQTLDQAVTNGLLEWIERDAMAIWWDNRVERPGVSVQSFDCRDLDNVVAGLRAIGRSLFLLDCTTDIRIPVYVAVAPRLDGSEPLIAGAAHPDPRIAAYKAASEVGQVWYEASRSGGLSQSLSDWLLHETTHANAHLIPSELRDAPRAEELRTGEDLLREVVEHLAAAGLEAYVVDLSRSDVVTHTARTVVPGLRHIWNRRAPGRLYDVPVKLGWRARPTPEWELNPIRCMV